MGRPKKDDSKCKEFKVRMSDNDIAKLNYLSDCLGMTKADIVREALSEFFKRSLRRKM